MPYSALGSQDDAKQAILQGLDDPVGFINFLIINGREDEHGKPITIDPQQIEVLECLKNGKWPVLQKARGTGGTAITAMAILWWLWVHDSAKIICNAPKMEQMEKLGLWPELKRWIVGSAIEQDFEWTKSKVFLRGMEQENYAIMQTAAEPERLQGGHDPFLLVVIEEASGVPDASFDALVASTTQQYNSVIVLFNPNFNTGFARELFRKPHGRFTPVHMPAYDLKTGWKHNLVSDESLEVLRRYGTESPQFRIFALGVPPLVDSNAVIPYEWVIEAQELELPVPEDYRKLWGVDPGYTGDRTGFCERIGPVVPNVTAWSGLNTMQIAGRIQFMYEDLEEHARPHEIFIDKIGIGLGVYDKLRDAGLPVRGIAVSNVPSRKEQYHRMRDELWWKAREWFESRAVSIPQEPKEIMDDFVAELTTPMYDIQSNGKVIIESKKEFKKRLNGRSPDLADALCLTFAGGIEIIEEHHQDRYRPKRGVVQTQSWKTA